MGTSVISLKRSQYLKIGREDGVVFTLQSGSVEIYVCTPEGRGNYQKVFLAELAPGDVFLPTDSEARFEFQAFAVQDSLIEPSSLDDARNLSSSASSWFKKLADLSWVKELAVTDEEVLAKWDGGSIFTNVGGAMKSVQGALDEHLEILRSVIANHLKSLENNIEIKREKRSKQNEKTLFSAMGNLLRTEFKSIEAAEESSNADDATLFAVRMAARHLGMALENISLPPDIAAKLDPVDRMRRLVRKGNMQVRLVSLSQNWHKSDAGVILGYFGESSDIVALIPDGTKRYLLHSTEHPLGIRVDMEVAKKIKSDAFLCYPGLPAKKIDVSDMVSFSLRNCWKNDFWTVLVMSFLIGALALVLPLITESVFKDIIPINDRQALGTVAQVMLVSGFTTAILSFARSVAFLRIKNHVRTSLESALWSRLLSLPASFFRKYEAGDLVNRMQGVAAITELFGEVTLSAIFNTIFSFWSLLLMMYYSVRLTVMATAAWIVYILISGFLYKKMMAFRGKHVEASNLSSARTLQVLNGLSKFRLQGGEPAAFNMWSKAFGEEWKWNLKIRWYTNYTSLFNSIQPIIMTMIFYYVAVALVLETPEGALPALDYAKFMGFQTAFAGFNATLVAFIPVVAGIFNVKPYVENIKPILEAEPEVTDDKMDVGVLSGAIEVKNLHFSYAPDSPMVLDGISFHVKAGESIALVGPSGCGKSTLLRILLGFEKPSQGAIYYDGQDFSTLNVTSVRSQMGVVLQNGQLFAGDIFNNIVGSSPLTLDDAWEAARMVGLDKDISNMPMGMHTVISEGAGNISGGQRQRILIARSIANRPKIVVLDEATSALDNTTQSIVTESMDKMSATRLIVAHRLSTIRNADRILVFNEGKIAEEGDFNTLMKMDGLFAKLARRQLA
ncbi:MAG: NHLP bacteriocin export ABC transporter permease/ATPase subunit [Synergistaceae bacterium]|jgi:ATP-binding cassette subfamily C protein|nr:NHLP bacteriocin export ABC transporter permease/ATPase subunit [Synergistaceae bacterium]